MRGHSGAAPLHPVNRALLTQRAGDLQLRVADGVTAFAGSMPFVHLHTVGFAAWMILLERSPLIRQVHALTTELHRRLVTEPRL